MGPKDLMCMQSNTCANFFWSMYHADYKRYFAYPIKRNKSIMKDFSYIRGGKKTDENNQLTGILKKICEGYYLHPEKYFEGKPVRIYDLE